MRSSKPRAASRVKALPRYILDPEGLGCDRPLTMWFMISILHQPDVARPAIYV